MKERPIIFDSPMVRAILEGRKTMTRRPIKPQPIFEDLLDADIKCYLSKCPYGQPGDVFWVRETWAMIYKDKGCLHSEDEIKCPCEGCNIEYKADMDNPCPGEWNIEDAREDPDAPRWRSPIHMPRWASRITLEIVNMRVERLQEISQKDAVAEGVHYDVSKENGSPLARFEQLWDSIYSKKGMGWNVNPWVWVIEFKRIDNAKRT